MNRFHIIPLLALLGSLATGASNAADSTNQGKVTVNGRDCTIVSTMVIGSDGKPHSTTRLVCR